ncbi:MAG TPA: hypothetical protein VFG23_00830 [Polyangia bacterium]|nr:hypothetical protein [Polyangia bacterium]
MKQAQSIEIAYLINGEVISVRRLSRRGEWRSAASTFGLVAALSMAAALVVALVLVAAHRVVYGPAYMSLWFAIGAGVAALAASRAAGRARTYQIGASIDDDAFSAIALPLVRRTGAGYRIALISGFTGRIEGGRAPLPIESLAQQASQRPVEVPIEAGDRVELSLGATTFVVRSLDDAGRAPLLPKGAVRRFVRRAFLPLELAALASIFCAVPVGAQIGEAEMKSAIPDHATPWEVEKALRAEAQTQAAALHQCFDVLPISCQRSGYVGVGVSLSREGEIRSHWIARSTYGAECPVERCMSEVVSNWFFEPIPESIRVVLPVQVLRTDRPLPYGPARAAADLERSSLRAQGPVGKQPLSSLN